MLGFRKPVTNTEKRCERRPPFPPPELVDTSLRRNRGHLCRRFRDRVPDWEAFEDAKIEGYKRAQHRFIGAGGSGKHGDTNAIPARAHTLSIMYVEPGQGNAPHTHEVEETFFVLKGLLDVFVEDEDGRRLETRLGPGSASCPPGVIQSYDNNSLEPVWFQVMLGRGQPETMGYADEAIRQSRRAPEERRLKASLLPVRLCRHYEARSDAAIQVCGQLRSGLLRPVGSQ